MRPRGRMLSSQLFFDRNVALGVPGSSRSQRVHLGEMGLSYRLAVQQHQPLPCGLLWSCCLRLPGLGFWSWSGRRRRRRGSGRRRRSYGRRSGSFLDHLDLFLGRDLGLGFGLLSASTSWCSHEGILVAISQKLHPTTLRRCLAYGQRTRPVSNTSPGLFAGLWVAVPIPS